MSSSKKRKSRKYRARKQGFPKSEAIEKKIDQHLIGLVTETKMKPATGGKPPVRGEKARAPVKKITGIKKKPPNIEKKATGPIKKPLSLGEKVSEHGETVAVIEKKAPGSEKTFTTSPKHRHSKLWIIMPVVFAVTAISVLAGLYYYALYYNKPNFVENGYNKILQSTSGPVKPGQEIQYSIEFMNTGNTDITNLLIETEIPANTDIITSSSNSIIEGAGNRIKFNVSELAKNSGGKVFFSVKVKSPLDNGTKIVVSEVIFNYISREKQKQYKIIRGVESSIKSSPDFSNFTLSFKDLTSKNIIMGDDILFTLTLSNTGDMDAADVKLTNLLPDKFILDEDSLQPRAFFYKDTGEIVWDIAKISAEQHRVFSFKAKISDNFDNLETFKDTAFITYKNESIKEVSVEDKVLGQPNFSNSTNTVEHPAANVIWAGDILKYTVNVINSGLRAGEDIELFCPIPKGAIYVKNSGSHADFMDFDQENNVLRWKIKTIDVNETLGFSFETRISGSFTRGGTIKSAFYIRGGGKDYEIAPAAINVKSYIFQTIVCMGDSQIIISNWPAHLDAILESAYPHAEYNTIGSGVPQQMAYQGVGRFGNTVAPYKPQIIVIGYGTNDVGSGTSLFASGIQDLINQAKGIGATVIVHSIGFIDTNINPAKQSYPYYNDVLKQVCAENGVPYVDIAGPMSEDPGLYISSDGMHWTYEGGQLVAHLVYNVLNNYLDEEGKRK
jgi:uncharacterized repeat protein (TIGR01451 family)